MAFVPPKALRDYVGKWAKENPEEDERYKNSGYIPRHTASSSSAFNKLGALLFAGRDGGLFKS